MQNNFDHEIHCATEAHRRGNKPLCRYHLLQAIESLDAPQHQHLRDLPLQTKVQATDAQVWMVIKHEPEVRRVKLLLLTSENHQEWDAPEDTRVEWRKTGCCEIWTIVPTQYTWEQAEAAFRSGRTIEGRGRDSDPWMLYRLDPENVFEHVVQVFMCNVWTRSCLTREELVRMQWRPYNPGAK